LSSPAERRKLRVGVVFGSRSVEHEVSIVTALQVIHALDRSKYDVLPIYITKEGQWLTGDALARIESYKDLKLIANASRAILGPEPGERALVARSGGLLGRPSRFEVDVVFPCVHGTYGEDGTLQGLLELADVPYVGAGVVGSAVGMDKIVMKAAFQAAGIPTVRYVHFVRSRWERSPDSVVAEVEATLRYPLFVKPANLGSSIGISKARDREGLIGALEVAAQYDRRLLVEESAEGAIEINCSVLGNDEPMASVCEQPVAWQEFLSYDDKYLRGGKGQSQGMKSAQRRIPAPISDELTRRVQELAVAAFRAVDCAGIARVDCLVHESTGEVLVNEINTIPGSMSFYLWEASGIPFANLTDRLVQLALERHADRARSVRSYDSAVIAKLTSGTKGRGAQVG
jgi:D-alanine-D-alanine ligase